MTFRYKTRRRAPDLCGLRRLAGLGLLVLFLTGCAATPNTASNDAPTIYSFWPSFPDEPRLQFLTSFAFSDEIEEQGSAFEDLIYGRAGKQVLPIEKPYGVAMRQGRIYVCDIRNKGVVVLDLVKHETRLLGQSGMAQMASPCDIAMSDDGRMYVSDSGRGTVFVYDINERHILSIGEPGMKPTGVDIFGDELFVCDYDAKTIVVYDRFNGQRKRSFGGPDLFAMPVGLAVNPEGVVNVVDVLQCKVQMFSTEGELLGSFGQPGDTFGCFARPKLIEIDRDGTTYVVDASFQNVQMFNSENQLLTFFGSTGNHPGAMFLPAGIAINDDSLSFFERYMHPAFEVQRLAVVTNQFGPNKVSVYGLGRLKPGKTVEDISVATAEMNTGLANETEAAEQAPPGSPIAPPGSSEGDSNPGAEPAPAPARADPPASFR